MTLRWSGGLGTTRTELPRLPGAGPSVPAQYDSPVVAAWCRRRETPTAPVPLAQDAEAAGAVSATPHVGAFSAWPRTEPRTGAFSEGGDMTDSEANEIDAMAKHLLTQPWGPSITAMLANAGQQKRTVHAEKRGPAFDGRPAADGAFHLGAMPEAE